jgi:hypothetical protein
MAEYADTPWWSNLIAVLVTAAVSVLGTLFLVKGGGSAPGAPPGMGQKFGALIKDTLVYIPHALLLFGVIADMLTQQGVYSIASLIGIISLPIHFLFKFIWKGVFDFIDKVIKLVTEGPMPQNASDSRANAPTRIKPVAPVVGGASFFQTYDGCDIQGFDWAHSKYAPQSLVLIATIFSYYTFDLVQNRGMKNSIATIVLGAFFFIAQLVLAGDCTAPEDGEPVPKLYKAVLALAEGLFSGGISYTVVQAYYPERLPSSAISPFPKTTPNMLKDGKFDKDGNPWVCVNGVCYPDMSTQEARKAFADIAAASLGNGRAAVGEDCPAK